MDRSAIHALAKRGQSQRSIARQIGVSRNTVAQVLAEPVDRQFRSRSRSSATDRYRLKIEEWLRQGTSVVRMLELVRGDPEDPYRGGRSAFGERVRKIRAELDRQNADVAIRFEGLPGEYLQVDWGESRRLRFSQHEGGKRYFLCCRLKYSRWSWILWTEDMRQETLLRGLTACFNALGFIPWVLVFDNMRTVTTGRDADNQAIWHPALARFAAEFGFHPQACAVARGNQKGSVESLVKWVKGNFLHGRSFADDRDLAEQTTAWLADINARDNEATGQAPIERLVDEAASGGVVPPTARDYGLPESARVNAESLVRVRGNSYSVPVDYRGMTLTVRLHGDRVMVFHDQDLVAEHRRSADGGRRRLIDARHFEPMLAKKPRARVMLYRQQLLDLGGIAQGYIAELSCRRRHLLGEQVLAMHGLLGEHGRQALLDAMERMAALDAFGAEYLEAVLTTSSQEPNLGGAGLGGLAQVPAQSEVDRALVQYDSFAIVSVGGAAL
jgi:transposase